MSRLPRLSPGAKVTGRDYNLLAAAIDAGGAQNIASQTTGQGITGQGLTQNFPITPGSTNPLLGSSSAPNTPTGLTAIYGIDYFSQTHDGYIVLTWTPNPVQDNIGRYDIYWHKGSDNNLHQLTVGGDVNLARINSVIPGQTYVFAIQAHDTAGRGSQFSQEISITISPDVDPPAVPTGLTLTAFTKAIFVQWTEVGPDGISNDLKQYQIQIDTSSSFNVSPYIATLGPGNSYYYPYASSGTVLYFRIRSADWTGNVSAWSNTVNATVG